MELPVGRPAMLPKIIGHRGVAGHAPENTLASIRKAADMKVAWIEFDVMLSGDGDLVLMHDETVDRTTNGKGRVADLSVAELKQFDAGSWFASRFRRERVPTLLETADLLSDLGLNANLEIKAAKGQEAETGWAVGRFLATEWPQRLMAPIVSSFSKVALEAAAVEAPGFPRGLLVERIPRNWRAETTRLGCSLIHCNHRYLRKAEAAKIRDSGLHLLCYTVNEGRRARQLWNWGVDAVFSDYPDRLLDI
jgi:glycerophosphoryl diester phosphodiesterase